MLAWILPVLIVAGPPFLSILLQSIVQHELPKTLTNRHIALVVAHPDDESMFFAPTVQALFDPAANNTVRIVSLSNGNAENLGKIRTNELRNAARVLGATNVDEQVAVIDHPELQDSMTVEWDTVVVHDVLEELITEDTIITFDNEGISGHTNHKSLFVAAIRWKAEQVHLRSVWVLNTVPVYRKYTSFVDALYTYLEHEYFPHWRNPIKKNKEAIIIATPAQLARGREAMVKAHVSQMKWFRWFYIQFSRYMVINDLVEI